MDGRYNIKYLRKRIKFSMKFDNISKEEIDLIKGCLQKKPENQRAY